MKTTSTLVFGCDIISRRLRYCLSPMGWLFKFDPDNSYRPRPLTLLTVLLICCTSLVKIYDFILIRDTIKGSRLFQLARESVFVVRLFNFNEMYRVISYVATLLIVLAHHGPIANVMALSNNMVSRKEQAHFARLTFAIYFFISIAKCVAFMPFFEVSLEDGWAGYLRSTPLMLVLIFLNITFNAPIMYTCYLGTSLGKHVENFSTVYVDTMFDQFMKAIDREELGGPQGLGEAADEGSDYSDEAEGEPSRDNSLDEGKPKRGLLRRFCCCHGLLSIIFGYFKRFLNHFGSRIRRLKAHLNYRKYPELPEMKMSKLSSTTSIKISESMRMSNSRLVRVRLRRTQNMLSELRDVVSDINKMSSPLIMLQIVYDTVLIVLVSNVSIQSKLFKSISSLILPTVVTTICLTINVLYICTCLDDTTSQLKLMINKLFDFIIMNHRVHSSTAGKQLLEGDMLQVSSAFCHRNMGPIGGREDESLSETWSQFQYTRKLANTIQFTMGGILPVSRRLVLNILGHILSVVFISIEIMSIVDTSSPTGHTGHPAKGITKGGLPEGGPRMRNASSHHHH